MSDVELIIKIPEVEYNKIKENDCKLFNGRYFDIIRNGAPLDKIRERIELEKLGYPPSAGYFKAIIKVLQIIDKYKVESEDKE